MDHSIVGPREYCCFSHLVGFSFSFYLVLFRLVLVSIPVLVFLSVQTDWLAIFDIYHASLFLHTLHLTVHYGCSRIFKYSNRKIVFKSWWYYSNTSNCSNIQICKCPISQTKTQLLTHVIFSELKMFILSDPSDIIHESDRLTVIIWLTSVSCQ